MIDYFEEFNNNISFRVWDKDKVIYEEGGKWLYPAFHFKRFIKEKSFEDLYLHDTKMGKALAFVIISTGIKHIYIDSLSKRAVPILEKYKIDYHYINLIDRVPCKTEDTLLDINNLEEALPLIENLYNKDMEKTHEF